MPIRRSGRAADPFAPGPAPRPAARPRRAISCGASRTRRSSWSTRLREHARRPRVVEHHPVRLALDLPEREPAAPQPEPVAARAGPQHQVHHPPRREPHARPYPAAVAPGRSPPSRPARARRTSKISHSSRASPRARHHGLRVLDERAEEELLERGRHVLALEPGGRRAARSRRTARCRSGRCRSRPSGRACRARAESAAPSGTDCTGLPAVTISARSCPARASRSPAPSAWPASGRARRGTRRCASAARRRWRARPRSAAPSRSSGELPNTRPPGRSRLPVTAASASSRKAMSVPCRPRHDPVRP